MSSPPQHAAKNRPKTGRSPTSALEAVTHPDPYPYYSALVSRSPLGWDDALGCWVAASAAGVEAVFASPLCRVRPPAEPVPAALVDSAAGDYFGRLARMRDGPQHTHLKAALSAALGNLAAHIAAQSERWAQELGEQLRLRDCPEAVMTFAFDLSVYAIASALGVERRHLPQMAQQVGELVRCLAPGATAAQLKRGQQAADDLRDLALVSLLLPGAMNSPESQLGSSGFGYLRAAAEQAGVTSLADVAANGIGLLTQAYEATAGLIGNTLLALMRNETVNSLIRSDLTRRDRIQALVDEVLRYDPPVQNTRRYLAADGIVAGAPMRAGDMVLVVVAAANRDPVLNPEPDRFDVDRVTRRHFTFGAGIHACPGERLATSIAESAVVYLLRSNVDVLSLPRDVTYRPSLNVRVPQFVKEESHDRRHI